MSLSPRPGTLLWHCQGAAASHSPCSGVPVPGTGCGIAAGSCTGAGNPAARSSPKDPVLCCSTRSGDCRGRDPSCLFGWVWAMLLATLIPLLKGHRPCFGARRMGEGQRVLLMLVIFAVPASPSRCRCLFQLPCPFFCLILPPRARSCRLAPAAAPCAGKEPRAPTAQRPAQHPAGF